MHVHAHAHEHMQRARGGEGAPRGPEKKRLPAGADCSSLIRVALTPTLRPAACPRAGRLAPLPPPPPSSAHGTWRTHTCMPYVQLVSCAHLKGWLFINRHVYEHFWQLCQRKQRPCSSRGSVGGARSLLLPWADGRWMVVDGGFTPHHPHHPHHHHPHHHPHPHLVGAPPHPHLAPLAG